MKLGIDINYYLTVNLPSYDTVTAINTAQTSYSYNYVITQSSRRRIRRQLSSEGGTLSLIYHDSGYHNLIDEQKLIDVCITEFGILNTVKCLYNDGYKSIISAIFDSNCNYTVPYSTALSLFGLSENSAYVADNVDVNNPESSIIISYTQLGTCMNGNSISGFGDELNSNSYDGIEVTFVSSSTVNTEFTDAIINAAYLSVYALILCAIFFALCIRGLLIACITLYCILVAMINAAALLPVWGYGYFSAFNIMSIFILLGVGASAMLLYGFAWRKKQTNGTKPTWTMFIDTYSSVGWATLFTICAACLSLFSKLASPVVVISQLGAYMGSAVIVFYVLMHYLIIPTWLCLSYFVLPQAMHQLGEEFKTCMCGCFGYKTQRYQSYRHSHNLTASLIEAQEIRVTDAPSAPRYEACYPEEQIIHSAALSVTDSRMVLPTAMIANAVVADNANSSAVMLTKSASLEPANFISSSGGYITLPQLDTTVHEEKQSDEVSQEEVPPSKRLFPKVKSPWLISFGFFSLLLTCLLALISIWYISQEYILNFGIPQLFDPNSNLGQCLQIAQDYKSSLLTSTSLSSISIGGLTLSPTESPIISPYPSIMATVSPTQPTFLPSIPVPSMIPTLPIPSFLPTIAGTDPTFYPTFLNTNPTFNPTNNPTEQSSSTPTVEQASPIPTFTTTAVPSESPTIETSEPTFSPTTSMPTDTPVPTLSPTSYPSNPSFKPTPTPTAPSPRPTRVPTTPTVRPSPSPTERPTRYPIAAKTFHPTVIPSCYPTSNPSTLYPTTSPSTLNPTASPSTPYPTTDQPTTSSPSTAVPSTAAPTSTSTSSSHTDYTVNGCWGIYENKEYIDSTVEPYFNSDLFQNYVDSGGVLLDLYDLCTYVDNNRDDLQVSPFWNVSTDCIYSQVMEAQSSTQIQSLPASQRTVTNVLLYWASLSYTSGNLFGIENSINSTSIGDFAVPIWLCANFSVRSYVSSILNNPSLAVDQKAKWESAFSSHASTQANAYGVPSSVGSTAFTFPLLAAEVLQSIELALLISVVGFVGLIAIFSRWDVVISLIGSLLMLTVLCCSIAAHIFFFTRILDLLDIVVLIAIIGMLVDFPIHLIMHFLQTRRKVNNERTSLQNDPNSDLMPVGATSPSLSTTVDNRVINQSNNEMANLIGEDQSEAPNEQIETMNPPPKRHEVQKNTNQYIRMALIAPMIFTALSGTPLLFADLQLIQKTGQYIILLAVISFLLTTLLLPYMMTLSLETHVTADALQWLKSKIFQ